MLPVSSRLLLSLVFTLPSTLLTRSSACRTFTPERSRGQRDTKQAGHETLHGCYRYTEDSRGLRRCWAAGKGTFFPHNQSHLDALPLSLWSLAPRPARASMILWSWLCLRRNTMFAIVRVARTRCSLQRCLVQGLFSRIEGITDVARKGGQEPLASGRVGGLTHHMCSL